MKKILYIFIFLSVSFYNFLNVNANNNETYFIVTAYYSPLPNQEQYSYSVYKKRYRTYEEEKRLQGEGIRGASGKKVFVGMLAGPKTLRFGTKIYLEGLGVGEIADRGQAIVTSGKRGYTYDRLDVWMGYGDEGLKRASEWGKRKVKGKIVDKNAKITLNYDHIKFDYIEKEYKKKIDIFKQKIKTKEENKILQQTLKDLGFYKGEITGIYKDVIDAVYSFQLSKQIVKSKYDIGAGNYGPLTRKELKESYNKYLLNREKEKLKIIKIEEKKKKLLKKIEEMKKLSFKKANTRINNIGNIKFGEVSYSVRELQKVLKELGYFNFKDTAIFGKITKDSLISYQLDKKIISNKNELGAGIVGPKTKKALLEDLNKNYFLEIVKKEKENLNSMLTFLGKNPIEI